MIFHENLLLAGDSHEISCLICYFGKKQQNFKLSSTANYRWRFKGSKGYKGYVKSLFNGYA